MNDPMEGDHRLSSIFGKSRKSNDIQTEIDSFGIASFSEIKDHEPIWAYYANSFGGMCISYSTRKLLSGLSKENELVRMYYSEKPPLLLKNKETTAFRAKLALSCKTLRWANERKWRLFLVGEGKPKYNDKDTVTAIYLGSRISLEIRTRISSFAGKSNIKIYNLMTKQYKMNFDVVKNNK